MTRLEQQIEFIKEIDKLKEIYRRSYLFSKNRNENSAEHCWHVAVMTLILSEHADGVVNVGRVVEMLLIHDIVEIDAGDTFCYDEDGMQSKEAREKDLRNIKIFTKIIESFSKRMSGFTQPDT